MAKEQYKHLHNAEVDASDTEIDQLWEDFHRLVNMSSEQLRRWLLTGASGERAFPATPDLNVPALGEEVVYVLRKRKKDLTHGDIGVMRQVVAYVNDRIARGSDGGGGQPWDHWRRGLMTAGHDPLQPSAPVDEESAPGPQIPTPARRHT